MTRFYSEYEIKKIDKKLNEDIILNNDRNKEELKDALDQDNHRSNVDRAKKKAVTQYMDYDGFHQMVLGADLKGMKMSDVIEIKPDKEILNTVTEKQKLGSTGGDIFYRRFIPQHETKEIKFLADDEMNLYKFKTKWKNFDNSNDKVNFLYDNIGTIPMFKQIVDVKTIDADIFIELLYHLGIVINEAKEKNEKTMFLIACVETIENCYYFSKMKMFIGKKQKAVYEEMKTKEWMKEINEIGTIIDKILSK